MKYAIVRAFGVENPIQFYKSGPVRNEQGATVVQWESRPPVFLFDSFDEAHRVLGAIRDSFDLAAIIPVREVAYKVAPDGVGEERVPPR